MATITATFKVRYPEWQAAFDEWRRVCNLSMVQAMRFQAKQIASALILGYEPRGSKQWNQSTPPNDRKQGEGALVRDVYRAIYPLRAGGFRDVKLRRRVNLAVNRNDVEALQAMVRAGVFGAARVNLTVRPAGEEYASHQDSRQSRGRVLRKHPLFATVGTRTLKEYIAKAKHAVGQAKGGWASSLAALGGRVPAWVARHSKAGTCIDNLKPRQSAVSFSMINRSKWGMYNDEARRITDSVMANRAELIKADIEFLVERGWKRGEKGHIIKP